MATETKAAAVPATMIARGSALCQECNDAPSIYACPRCSFKSCSLACCKSHKNRTGCTGKRNRTEFLPLARMSDATLRSDYHFLEDVLTNVEGGKRLLKSVGGAQRSQQQNQQSPPPVHEMMRLTEKPHDDDDDDDEPSPSKRPRHHYAPKWNRLVQQAQDRGTTVLLMPSGMQRHKSNTSWYQVKTNTIFWKVDLILHSSTTAKQIITIPKVSEHANIWEELRKVMPDVDQHHLLMKRLPCPCNDARYVELAKDDVTLKTALQDMTVIEYPTIEVVPSDMLESFPRFIHEV